MARPARADGARRRSAAMFARLTRTAPAFWGRPPGLLADLLLPIGAAWDAAAHVRRALSRSYCSTIPVVCIGNLVAGGAGKTPVTLALAAWLRERGVPTHVVARGYGGYLRGPIRVEPTSGDGVAGARAAVTAGASAVMLDDGFQDPAIDKTLALSVVDAEYGLGNGRVMPAGPLRENLRGGIARADAVVVLRAGSEATGAEQTCTAIGRPVIRAALVPTAGERLAGERLLAFAGIGRPEKFFTTLRGLGAILVDAQAFPDHHLFRAAEIDLLRRNAAHAGARLITTRKDIVRLPTELRAGIDVLEVKVRWLVPAAITRLMAPVIFPAGGDGSVSADCF